MYTIKSRNWKKSGTPPRGSILTIKGNNHRSGELKLQALIHRILILLLLGSYPNYSWLMKFNSGPEIEKKQFLLLRVLWPVQRSVQGNSQRGCWTRWYKFYKLPAANWTPVDLNDPYWQHFIHQQAFSCQILQRRYAFAITWKAHFASYMMTTRAILSFISVAADCPFQMTRSNKAICNMRRIPATPPTIMSCSCLKWPETATRDTVLCATNSYHPTEAENKWLTKWNQWYADRVWEGIVCWWSILIKPHWTPRLASSSFPALPDRFTDRQERDAAYHSKLSPFPLTQCELLKTPLAQQACKDLVRFVTILGVVLYFPQNLDCENATWPDCLQLINVPFS